MRLAEWYIAMCKEAASFGVDLIVLGDDAGHRGGPMISPQLWHDLVLPCHRRIVEELDVPLIWHSDGTIEPLLPMAIAAGVRGIHGLEPGAGIDPAKVKREFGDKLVLVENVDVARERSSKTCVRRCRHPELDTNPSWAHNPLRAKQKLTKRDTKEHTFVKIRYNVLGLNTPRMGAPLVQEATRKPQPRHKGPRYVLSSSRRRQLVPRNGTSRRSMRDSCL